jgi:hypothetical protein
MTRTPGIAVRVRSDAAASTAEVRSIPGANTRSLPSEICRPPGFWREVRDTLRGRVWLTGHEFSIAEHALISYVIGLGHLVGANLSPAPPSAEDGIDRGECNPSSTAR